MATAQVVMLPGCESCEGDDAKWVCEDCCINLCDKCKNAHQRIPKTKNDTIIPVGHAKKGSKKKATPVLCGVHGTKICGLYCFSCETLICAQCLAESHRTHKFDSVETFTDSKVSELDNIEQNYKRKLSLYERVLDSESRNHTQYLTHIDQLEVEVKGQTDKIVSEFYKLRDQQLSELSVLRKNEEERYRTKCKNYQSETKAIRKHVESVKKAKVSGNVTTMMEIMTESTQSYQAIEDPTLSNLPRPDFEHHDEFQPQLFLQLQGRINVRDPDVERKQKTTTVPQGDVRFVFPKPAIDMQNVKVKSNIQLKGKQGFVSAFIPIGNNMAWVVIQPDNHLTLIDVKGNVVRKSSELSGKIWYAVANQGDILVACKGSHRVMRLGKDGDTFSVFTDVSPFFTFGLCVTSNLDVLVCLVSSLAFDSSLTSKVIRLDSQGKVIQEIQYINQQPLFTAAAAVTSLPTGDVVVADNYAVGKYRVVCVNNSGNMTFNWNGEVKGRIINNMRLVSITHDGQKVYITDYNNHCMYLLDSDVKAEQFMLDKLGITYPVAINIDSNRRLWIGCKSNIYMLE